MFFYLIYSLPWGAELSSGKRNSRLFFFGWMLYTLFYVIIKNLMLSGALGIYGDAIYSGFIWMAIGDIATMAYLYRHKYGRVIFHELEDDIENKWEFNENTNKYTLKHAMSQDDQSVNIANANQVPIP
jgi:hypothetical protein